MFMLNIQTPAMKLSRNSLSVFGARGCWKIHFQLNYPAWHPGNTKNTRLTMAKPMQARCPCPFMNYHQTNGLCGNDCNGWQCFVLTEFEMAFKSARSKLRSTWLAQLIRHWNSRRLHHSKLSANVVTACRLHINTNHNRNLTVILLQILSKNMSVDFIFHQPA
jgi:hypothetical protein